MKILENSQIIVIKIGSMLVRGDTIDSVNQEWINSLASDVNNFINMGKRLVIVSSGGVALGRKALGISPDISPNKIPLAKKQAASAVGQYHVFNAYHKAFQKLGITAAQVLLTISETENRRMNLNARETLYTLLENNIIPVINENDVVSTEEIRFGDNDRLAVRVAQMIQADTVILFSTIDGLYTDNPQMNDNAEHIPVIESLGDEHTKMAGEALSGLSTGGMKSKIEAAQNATQSGIDLIITDGQEDNPLTKLLDNKRASIFLAQKSNKSARKTWIGTHMNPKGTVTIDEGAYDALKNGKSLLPIGIKHIEGSFQRGDAIEIHTHENKKIAVGLSAYASEDAKRIIGKNSREISNILGYAGRNEVIHRNDMVLV